MALFLLFTDLSVVLASREPEVVPVSSVSPHPSAAGKVEPGLVKGDGVWSGSHREACGPCLLAPSPTAGPQASSGRWLPL